MKSFDDLGSARSFSVAIAFLTLVSSASVALASSPGRNDEPAGAAKPTQHNLKHPLGARQFSNRQQAIQDKLAGKAKTKIYRIANGQYVELEREATDRVFVILAEFGDQINTVTGGTPGPLHNQIAQPDRAQDNVTIWKPDFNQAHFSDLYFSPATGADSMVNYFREQSSGRYSIEGRVVDWVRVPFNEARYGTNLCGGNVCSTVWRLVQDAVNIWTANQLASGKTPAQVKAELDQFDVWDRYDYDGDGNFNEPDGYIDHFQIVHAGEGEETGGGAQGTDAIWSHRWYAFFNNIGAVGPAFNKSGGAQFGNVGVWVGDYTIQPENGGLGVFAHEYGHDLGLPDEYDTSGLGASPSDFWTLMAAGSYLGRGTVDIGARPGHLNAWDKLQLGWLNYEISYAGQLSTHKLGPASFNTKQAQAVFTVLPRKERKTVIAAPFAGTMAWWSGSGDNLDNHMRRSITLPAGSVSLSMQAWYNIEVDWDYAYVRVSTDGGATWFNLPTSLSTNTSPNGQNFGNGITGSSGGWVVLTADLSAYAGQTVLLGLRYWTDGAVQGKGFMADNILVTAGATTVFSDGAEAGDNGWTLAGFKRTTGTETSYHNHYYVSEYRQYKGFDEGLRTGPYNFGFVNAKPDWVEHFPLQDGLLVSYWDTSMADNDVGLHPGEGLILPIDARPVPLIRPDGQPWRTRIQVYDATFSLDPSDAITLHLNSVPSYHPSLPAVSVFDDTKTFWYALKPDAGVKVGNVGVKIEVISQSAQDSFMQIIAH